MRLLFVSLVLAFSVSAATPPPGYLQLSAAQKREWHVKQGESSPYWLHPGTLRTACGQGIALIGFASARYLRQPVESGSGYADGWWRWLTGKAIHRHGPMAAGEVTLEKPLLGLEPGTHPVTMRFSLANVFLPRISAARFRLGLVVIFHRDGKEDVSLFLMPKNGLDGYEAPQNPFDLKYTNSLALPAQGIQDIARRTFGRAVVDVYHQRVQGADAVELVAHEGWKEAFAATRPGALHDRLAALPPARAAEPLFDLLAYDGEDGPRSRLGLVSIIGGWIVSKHANRWYVQHNGFTPTPKE